MSKGIIIESNVSVDCEVLCESCGNSLESSVDDWNIISVTPCKKCTKFFLCKNCHTKIKVAHNFSIGESIVYPCVNCFKEIKGEA